MNCTMGTIKYICALPLLMLLGCASASAPAHHQIETSRQYSMSFDTAWQSMLQIAAADCDQITLAQKDSGLITFQKSIPIKDLDRYAHNATGLLLDHTLAHICLMLSADGKEHVLVAINCRIIATGRSLADVFLSRNRQVSLPSRGMIENNFFDRLHSLASSAHGKNAR